MNSIEKVNQLLAEYTGPPPPDVEPFELAIRTTAMSIGPMIAQLLPDDARVVDEALEKAAAQILALRSDDVVDGQAVDEQPALPAGDGG